MFVVVCWNGSARIKNGLKLRTNNKIQDIQQPDKHKTYSDKIMKVPKKVAFLWQDTGTTMSERSVTRS